MTVRENREDLLRAISSLLKPIGFKKHGNEFHRSRGLVHQIVRIDTLRESGNHLWRFRIADGATTEHIVKIIEGENKKFHPAYGPLYRDSRHAHCGNWDYYSVETEADYISVKEDVLSLLVQFVIPALDRLDSEAAIIHALRTDPNSCDYSQDYRERVVTQLEANP